MEPVYLEVQEAEPLDPETIAAIELAQEQARRGEVVTLEQAKINIRKRSKAGRQTQREAKSA